MTTYTYRTTKTLADVERMIRTVAERWGCDDLMIVRKPSVRGTAQSRDERRVRVVLYKRGAVVQDVSYDKLDTQRDNLFVLAKCLEDMRMIEVRGLTDVYEQVYGGVPATMQQPMQIASTDPYAVLGVSRTDSLQAIEAVWKARIRYAHPDQGGNTEEAARYNAAMAAIRKERAP